MKTKIVLGIFMLASACAVIACGNRAAPGDSENAAGNSSSPASGNNVAAPVPQGFGPSKTVQIFDPMFNMVANTLSVPASWQFEGAILHGPGCGGDYNGTAFRAYSADMTYGIQLLPSTSFVWSNDSRAMPKGAQCKDLQPISAGDYGTFISGSIRPNSVIDSIDAAPDEADFLAGVDQNNQALARMCANQHTAVCPKYKGEAKVLHIHYNLNGHAEEENLEIQMTVEDQPVSIQAPPQRPGQVFQILKKDVMISNFTVTGVRAPQGQLKSVFPSYLSIVKSFKVDPNYLAKFTAFENNKTNQQIAASWQTFHSIMQQSDQQMAQMRANAQQAIKDSEARSDARQQQFNATEAAKSGHAQDVSDYLLDQQYYVNPTTGQTTTQSNAYNHTYSNGSGPGSAILQTNSPTPPAQGNWTELQPIKH